MSLRGVTGMISGPSDRLLALLLLCRLWLVGEPWPIGLLPVPAPRRLWGLRAPFIMPGALSHHGRTSGAACRAWAAAAGSGSL